jgi:WD40 repeat protein
VYETQRLPRTNMGNCLAASSSSSAAQPPLPHHLRLINQASSGDSDETKKNCLNRLVQSPKRKSKTAAVCPPPPPPANDDDTVSGLSLVQVVWDTTEYTQSQTASSLDDVAAIWRQNMALSATMADLDVSVAEEEDMDQEEPLATPLEALISQSGSDKNDDQDLSLDNHSWISTTLAAPDSTPIGTSASTTKTTPVAASTPKIKLIPPPMRDTMPVFTPSPPSLASTASWTTCPSFPLLSTTTSPLDYYSPSSDSRPSVAAQRRDWWYSPTTASPVEITPSEPVSDLLNTTPSHYDSKSFLSMDEFDWSMHQNLIWAEFQVGENDNDDSFPTAVALSQWTPTLGRPTPPLLLAVATMNGNLDSSSDGPAAAARVYLRQVSPDAEIETGQSRASHNDQRRNRRRTKRAKSDDDSVGSITSREEEEDDDHATNTFLHGRLPKLVDGLPLQQQSAVAALATTPRSVATASHSRHSHARIPHVAVLQLGSKIRSMDFAHNLPYLALAGDDGICSIYYLPFLDATEQQNEPICVGEVHRVDRIYAVKFSPNGRYLAIGGYDDNVAILDVQQELPNTIPPIPEQLEVIAEIPTNGLVLCLDWSPDSRFLALGGSDKCCCIVDVQASWRIQRMVRRPGPVVSLQWNPNARGIAVAAAGSAAVINHETGLVTHEVELPRQSEPHRLQRTAASPECPPSPTLDAATASGFQQRFLLMLESQASNGGSSRSLGAGVLSNLRSPDGTSGQVNRAVSLCWSPSGSYLVLCGSDGTCTLHEARSYSVIHELRRPTPVTTAVWGEQQTCRVWYNGFWSWPATAIVTFKSSRREWTWADRAPPRRWEMTCHHLVPPLRAVPRRVQPRHRRRERHQNGCSEKACFKTWTSQSHHPGTLRPAFHHQSATRATAATCQWMNWPEFLEWSFLGEADRNLHRTWLMPRWTGA